MSINLRYISKELQQALKVKAAEEDVTMQSLCVRYLWQGLEDAKCLKPDVEKEKA